MIDYSSPVTHHLLGVIFGVLIVASIIGFILAKRAKATGVGITTISNLNARTKSWWIMVLVLLGALSTGHTGTTIIFGFISFFALREFLTATPTRRADYYALCAAFFIVLPYQYYLVHLNWYGMFSIMIPVYAFVLLPILSVIGGDASDYLARTARTQWGLVVCVYSVSHIPMLLTLPLPTGSLRMGSAGLVLFLVCLIQGSDVLQYVWGKLCGRTPVAKLSPKKTLEGLIGGVLTASLLGAAMFRLTPFSPLQAFFISILLCLIAFFGGLVMSAIKRERGIKDWGTLIEGHGGMMDRIDSLCFSAPVYFHILRYYFT